MINILQVVAPDYLNDDAIPHEAMDVSQTYVIALGFDGVISRIVGQL
jgi:hypothetical protein